VLPRRYVANLRTVVALSAEPYGYTLTIWTSGAVLSHAHGIPRSVDALLFLIGAVAAYALVGSTAFGGFAKELSAERAPSAVWGSLHFVSVGFAIGAAALSRIMSMASGRGRSEASWQRRSFFLSPHLSSRLHRCRMTSRLANSCFAKASHVGCLDEKDAQELREVVRSLEQRQLTNPSRCDRIARSRERTRVQPHVDGGEIEGGRMRPDAGRKGEPATSDSPRTSRLFLRGENAPRPALAYKYERHERENKGPSWRFYAAAMTPSGSSRRFRGDEPETREGIYGSRSGNSTRPA